MTERWERLLRSCLGATLLAGVGLVVMGQTVMSPGGLGLGGASGDFTCTAAGVCTVTKTNGTSFGTAAVQNTGTSGANLPFANGTNTWAAAQTFTVAPVFTDASGSRTALGLAAVAASGSASDLGTGTLPNTRLVSVPNSALASSSITISGLSTALGGSYAPARSTATVAAPTGTSSASIVMLGLAGAITPATSGNLFISVSGVYANSVLTDGCGINLYFGTGTAPINGAAVTGTAVLTTTPTYNEPVAGYHLPFALSGYVTGKTLSTAYWYDLGIGQTVGGTCTLFAVNASVLEM